MSLRDSTIAYNLSPDFPYPVAKINQPGHKAMTMTNGKHSLGKLVENVGQVAIFAGEWLIDSGATNNYTSDRNLLTNFKEVAPVEITIEKGIIMALGQGDVELRLPMLFAQVIVHNVL